MSADRLPDRPNLDQLKRQAKDLLKTGSAGPRLRDAQRAVALQYGFASWDGLRDHVNTASGAVTARKRTHPGIDYEHLIPDTIVVHGPLTREIARQLAERGVSGIKVGAEVPSDALRYLAEIDTLERLDLSDLNELADGDLAFLGRSPELTAVAFARWGKTGDGAIAALSGLPKLSRLVLGPGLTDAGVERLRDFPALATPVDAESVLSISSARTLTDRALAAVGRLQGVTQLDVHRSVFGSPFYTARGVAHLKTMRALEALNFHGQLVTDAVLREIAAIPNLRSLHAQDVASGDEGFVALGQSVTIESLGLRFCHAVTDRGVGAIARLPRLVALNIGGHLLTDHAFAPLAAARELTNFSPPLSRDHAFAHIAKIPKLETLTNMYNRATTDAATRHLERHGALKRYSAFGTQITDESLRVLAALPRLEFVEIDNCAGVSDEGLRVLVHAPKLRRMSVSVCMRVTGAWLEAAPKTVEATFDGGNREYAEFYRAETLMDYPDLPAPTDMPRPEGEPPLSIAPALARGPARVWFDADGLQLKVDAGTNPRGVGVMTREAFGVPMTIDLLVRPLTELRIVFGAHNRLLAFNDRGEVVDVAPWFLRLDREKGTPQGSGEPIADDQWTRVTLEVDAHERRALVNGRLRHIWQGDFAGLRSRVAIGPRKSALTVRELKIDARN